jgi:hypothetical protein
VPEVDASAAERNLANRRVETFSILDPFRAVWETFAGSEDPYEVARRRAEERKMQTNQAPASPAGNSGAGPTQTKGKGSGS